MPADKVSVTQLTPLLFLERAADVFAERDAVVYGGRRESYAELAASAQAVARALSAWGIRPGDRVAYLLPNLPEMLVAHFAVPLAHGVLVAINTRLSGPEVTYVLQHSGARILVADTELLANAAPDLGECPALELLVTVDDVDMGHPDGAMPYDELLSRAAGAPPPWRVDDEERVISINYTSGTTGRPKGVMYTHRGAYLNALAEVVHSGHDTDSVYLWTLPMFHCNGWCTPWAVTAVGGRHVCLRAIEPARDLAARRRGRSHALQRRSNRAHHARQPSRRTRVRTPGHGDDRGRSSQPDHHPPDERARRPNRPRLRSDRDVRALHGVRVAARMGGRAGRTGAPAC